MMAGKFQSKGECRWIGPALAHARHYKHAVRYDSVRRRMMVGTVHLATSHA